jgi:exopolyphosphatase/guanosine-5'-triphosphate,3'-diphosphate pyrophosphatase
MKVAVIDVGYNSLKMVKYRIEPDGFAKTFGQFGVMAKLGEGLDQTGYLGSEQVERTIKAIRLCKENALLESIKHVLLVGTSPIREAANSEEFLRRVQSETGLRMRVLSGNEEALYGFLGGARSVKAPIGLYFDLGGGSLQLTYVENNRVRRILTLPLGALKLTAQYAGKDGAYSRKNRAKLNKLVNRLLPSRRELGLDKDTILVGTGGTVRAMARFQQSVEDYPINKIHNYTLEFDSVQHMSREFLRLKRDELGKIAAIGDGRSESVAAGALVIRILMKRLGFGRMIVSTHGVRDGILTEFLMRGPRRVFTVVPKEDIESMLVPQALPARYQLIVELVKCLSRNGVLDSRQEEIVLTAFQRGRAQECREVDADALFGILMSEDHSMSHEDQLFMAISEVRSRRSKIANWLVKNYGPFLLRNDIKSVRRMGACLRLMEVLDRSSANFRVSYSGGLRIVAETNGSFPIELAKVSADSLSQAIKRRVTVSLSNAPRKAQTRLVKAGGRLG